MQKCEFEQSPSKRKLLEEIRRKKVALVETAIRNEDFTEAYTLLEEIALICLDMDDMDLSIEFSEQARMLKARSGMRIKDVAIGTTLRARLDETREKMNKQEKMKGWLVDLQQKAMTAFASKDYTKTRFYIYQMLVIAKNLGRNDQNAIIKNYKQNLKKVEKLIKA